MKLRFHKCVFGLLFIMISQADARVRWSTPGSYRLRSIKTTSYGLDQSEVDASERAWFRHRLRVGPSVEAGPVFVYLQLDVLTGQIQGDTTGLGANFVEKRQTDPANRYDGWTTIEPRFAWAELNFEWMHIKAGQMPRHWGMGLFANDGEERRNDGKWVHIGGDSWNGDITDRVEVGFRPFAPFIYGGMGRLAIYGEAGIVYQDELASLLDDDDAVEFGGGITFPGEQLDWGLHYLRRRQTDRSSAELNYSVYDAHARWVTPFFLSHSELLVEAEAVVVSGRTSRAIGSDGGDLDFLGWSAISRVEWRWLCPRVALGIEGGFVSGDDFETERQEGLTLDPDYRVGLVLFSDVLRNVTVRGAERLLELESDGARLGSRDLPTDGGLRNVSFVAPGVTWRPGGFVVSSQILVAWNNEASFDREASIRAGQSVNPMGQKAETGLLGVELSGIVRYEISWQERGRLGLGADIGALMPGPVISPMVGDDLIPKIVWRLDLGW